jgi:small subunit ribosomal protein S19e
VGRSLGDTMTTHYDVPAELLLPAVAVKLGQLDNIEQPDWADDVKTGTNRERPPIQEDWWEMRCAAILRKVARLGPIGVKHLADEFGGPTNRNVRPNRVKTGSRHIIRTALKQLEVAGYVEKTITKSVENVYGESVEITKGRKLTKVGQKLLDECAHSVRENANELAPGLSKY